MDAQEEAMRQRNRWIILVLVIIGLGLSACTQKPVSVKDQPVKLEQIEGSDLQRVVLTEKAAERLGIQVVPVRNESVGRSWVVGGEVVTSPLLLGAGEAGTAPALSTASPPATEGFWVQVSLRKSDLSRMDRVQSVRVLPLNDDEATGWTAQEVEVPVAENVEEEDLEEAALYYLVDGAEPGLELEQRVLVELPSAGSGAQRIVIPYSAVIYDVHGGSWVYTNPEPLVYVRQRASIDFIEGNRAFLTVGPPTGVMVVTVGAAELLGAETGVSK